MNPSPGPWRWFGRGVRDTLLDAHDFFVVTDRGEGDGGVYVENDDDAALIASAPEMREMLLKLEAKLDNCPYCDGAMWSALDKSPDHGPDCPLAKLMERIR